MSAPPPADTFVRYPGHRWGFLAEEPWDPEIDRVAGDAWEEALRQARAARQATSPEDWNAAPAA